MTLLTLVSVYLVTSLASLVLIPLAHATGLIDYPGGRKTHGAPTPMIGGLGIYLGLLAAYILSPQLMPNFQLLLVLSGLVLIVGIFDDLYQVRASLRLILHASIALTMAWFADVRLDSFGDLLFTGALSLGAMAIPVTIFATVGVINAVNMSDGLDGLSGGLVTTALSFLSLAALLAGESSTLYVCLTLGLATLAFLTLNFRLPWNRTALLYLGDAGSTLLGFLLAWLLILASQGSNAVISPVYALWFLAVPLMDTVSLLIRRPLHGKSPFDPGRDHLHHRFLDAGFSPKQTVLMMNGAAIAFAAVGLGAHLAGAPDGAMFVIFMALFAAYLIATRQPTIAEDEANLTTDGASDELVEISGKSAPRHIAIIMDGNNRWAKSRGLRTKDGHRQGAKACKALIKDCIGLQIPYLTLFAFSSENWMRSEAEVRSLMALFRLIIAKDEIADLHEAGTRIRFIGNRAKFSRLLQAGMREIERRTANNGAITVSVALDYGGHWDIAQAVSQYVQNHQGEAISTQSAGDTAAITTELRSYLSTSDLPDPDLCIRTGGEHRLSNFLLWQLAYTELYFSDTYWPDFNKKQLCLALSSYDKRIRNFGRTADRS